MMEKSKDVLKYFFIVICMNIAFLGAELMAAFIEGKPMKIILCMNINCFVVLLVITIVKFIRKDYELPMYSALLFLGCSIAWVVPILFYGSIFGENTFVVTIILYVVSIGIGISIPVLYGKVDRNKPFWSAIRKIASIFVASFLSVLIVVGRIFRGGHGGRLMYRTMSTSSIGKLMWWIALLMSMILGGFSVFGIIGISQNPNSEFNQKRKKIEK